MTETQETREPLTPWRMVTGLGAVTMLADLVAAGGTSVLGPLLGELGASALVIGLVLGGAEAVARLMRLVAGPLSARFGHHWGWLFAGYGLTVVSVPLLFLTPMVGGVGLGLAATLIVLDRLGQGVRGPSRSALLTPPAQAIGTGKGFGVHKALNLTGGLLGPLAVAGIIAATGLLWPAFLALAVPGVLAVVLLWWLRARLPEGQTWQPVADAAPEPLTPASASRTWLRSLSTDLPSRLYVYAAALGLTTVGLVSFGIIAYHLVREEVVGLAVIPVVFLIGSAAAAVATWTRRWWRHVGGLRVLIVAPILVALVPGLALGGVAGWTIVGVVLWGLAFGLQDAGVKAVVTDLVPDAARPTAFGVFAVVQAVAALVGGALVGGLYDTSIVLLASVVAAVQALAALLIASVALRPERRAA